MAIFLFNDFLADRKANTGTWVFKAGMQALEYLKDFFLILWMDAYTIILNVDTKVSIFFNVSYANKQVAIRMPEF